MCLHKHLMMHGLISHLHIASSGYMVSIVQGAHFSLGLFLEIQFYTLNFHTSTTFKRRKTFKFLAEMESSIYENYPHTRMNQMECQGGIWIFQFTSLCLTRQQNEVLLHHGTDCATQCAYYFSSRISLGTREVLIPPKIHSNENILLHPF